MKRGVKKQSAPLGAIRIISGKWRGRKLPVLSAEGLRPTTDRTKETLFNWLMPYVSNSRCLDLFAGSGSLGFEALSRYANQVVFVELDKQACHILADNISKLQIDSASAQVINTDAIKALEQLGQPFDLIFLDPPFNKNLLPKVIEQIEQRHLLLPQAIIYIECERANDNYVVPNHWRCIKEKQTQQVSSRVYINNTETPENSQS